jgi:hypothetical protein
VEACPPQQPHSSSNNNNSSSRPSSSSTEHERNSGSLIRHKPLHHRSNGSIKTSCSYHSQSTINTTLCSRHSSKKSRKSSIHSSNSDPNTAAQEQEQLQDDDNEYFVNYAQTHLHQHAHRHPHTHRRHSHHIQRPSQKQEPQRPLSRSSIVSISNPEYFYGSTGTLNHCSCTNSKASLIPSKTSSRDNLINSTYDGSNHNDIEELYHYSRINTVPRRLPTPPRKPRSPPPPLPQKNQGMKRSPSDHLFKPIDPDIETLSSYAESSMTQSDKNTGTVIHGLDDDVVYNTNSLSDNSYATINEENRDHAKGAGKTGTMKSSSSKTQSIYNYTYVDLEDFGGCSGAQRPKASSLKVLTPTKFTVESYTLPLQHRRHRSCGSSDSFDDIDIPDYFSSPSRIRWNFLTGLPDRSRSQSRIGSSRNSNEFKTDDEQQSSKAESVCKVDEMLKKKASPNQRDKTVSIWHTSANGAKDDCNAIIFHHDSELVENCCKNHFQHGETSGGSSSTGTNRPRSSSSSSSKRGKRESECKDDDMEIYEFELCTMENCEYLLKSSRMPIESPPPNPEFEQELEPQPLLNNQIVKENIQANRNVNNQKPQNMKYNKLKKKSSKKSKCGLSASESTGSLKNDDFVTLNQLNYAYYIKKDTNNLMNNVNLKPRSNSSSLISLDAINSNSNILNNQNSVRNKLNYRQQQLEQQPLNIRSLLLASSTSRNDGNGYSYYSSNPNIAQSSMSSANMTSEVTSSLTNINNGCQFINNNINNNNSNLINNTNTNTYQSTLSNTINSSNNDNNNNNIMQRPLGRWRYNQYNINGLLRNVHKRARKYVNSLWTRDDDQ